VGAKRSLKSNAVALAEVCKANDERTFARMRGNDVDAPKADFDLTRERLANVKDSRAGNFAPS